MARGVYVYFIPAFTVILLRLTETLSVLTIGKRQFQDHCLSLYDPRAFPHPAHRQRKGYMLRCPFL